MCGQQPVMITGMKDMTWTCSGCSSCLSPVAKDLSAPCWCEHYNQPIPWQSWGDHVHPHMDGLCDKKHQLYLAKVVEDQKTLNEYTPVVTFKNAAHLERRVYCEDEETRGVFTFASNVFNSALLMRDLLRYHGYIPNVEVTKGDTPHSMHVTITATPPEKEETPTFNNSNLMNRIKENVEKSLNKFLSMSPEQQQEVVDGNIDSLCGIDDPETAKSTIEVINDDNYKVTVSVDNTTPESPVVTVTKEKTVTKPIDDHHTYSVTSIIKDIYTKSKDQ